MLLVKKVSVKPWICFCLYLYTFHFFDHLLSKYSLSHSHFFLLSTIFIFLFFSHTTQHNIQNTTKQNHRHILNISRSNQKGGGEGRTTRTQKSLLYTITYVQQKTLPSINGRRPGPTNSRRCTFTWHYLQEATDPICFSTHVWCKPVLDYCLHSCKTSKQHSLLHWTNTETRIIIKGIVHFEIKIWYLSAYPKGIQDVGVFFSSVDPILMFLGQTFLDSHIMAGIGHCLYKREKEHAQRNPN